jgi:hypothetical protein
LFRPDLQGQKGFLVHLSLRGRSGNHDDKGIAVRYGSMNAFGPRLSWLDDFLIKPRLDALVTQALSDFPDNQLVPMAIADEYVHFSL